MTPKMRKFAEALAAGRSGAESARRAGYKGASARVNASKMRRDTRVIAEIARIKNCEPRPEHTRGNALTPLSWLLSVMNDPTVEMRLRLRCAIAAAPYTNVNSAREGKKNEQARKAQEASRSFGARLPQPSVVPLRRPSPDAA